MQKWADNIKRVEDERIKLAIIAANNHYAGFGPGTANIFRKMLGLSEAKCEEKEEGEEQEEPKIPHDLKQRTLSDENLGHVHLLLHPSLLLLLRAPKFYKSAYIMFNFFFQCVVHFFKAMTNILVHTVTRKELFSFFIILSM
jgi:hypothetical protein